MLSVAERFKAVDCKSIVKNNVGSNPTTYIFVFLDRNSVNG